KGKAEADSLFGNLNTKIFHANADPITNEWASTLIGRTRQFLVNASQNSQAQDGFASMCGWGQIPQTNAGVTETIQFEVEPSVFTKLRTGGPTNKYLVEGLIFQNGHRFASSHHTWTRITFNQRK